MPRYLLDSLTQDEIRNAGYGVEGRREAFARVTSRPPAKRLSPRGLDHLSPSKGPYSEACRDLGTKMARYFRPILKGPAPLWRPGYQRGPRVARQLVGRQFVAAPFSQRRMAPASAAAVAIALDGSGSMWWPPSGETTTPNDWEESRMGVAKMLGQSLTHGLQAAGADVAVFTQRKAHAHARARCRGRAEGLCFTEALPNEDWNVLHGSHGAFEAVEIKGFGTRYDPSEFAYYTAGACADSGAHVAAAYNGLLNHATARTKILFILADGGLNGGDSVGLELSEVYTAAVRDGVIVILLSMGDPRARYHVPECHLRTYALVTGEDVARTAPESARMIGAALGRAR